MRGGRCNFPPPLLQWDKSKRGRKGVRADKRVRDGASRTGAEGVSELLSETKAGRAAIKEAGAEVSASIRVEPRVYLVPVTMRYGGFFIFRRQS